MRKTKKVLASLLAVAMAIPGMATQVSAKDLTQDAYVTLDNGLEVKLIAQFNGADGDSFIASNGDKDSQPGTQEAVFDNNTDTKVVFRKQQNGWGGVLQQGDYLGVEFKEAVSLKGIKFVFGDHGNDYFGNAKLQVKTTTADWADLQTYEGNNVTSVDFTSTVDLVNVTAVRLVNGTYKDNNWVHLYEIIVDAEIPTEAVADYLAVTKAINDANALNKNDYKSFKAVEDAIAAVDFNLTAADQAIIDGYAQAINDAIAALVQVRFELDVEDIEVGEVGNEHNDHRGHEPVTNIFDGNPSSVWHTNWDGSDRSTHWFTLNVKEALYNKVELLARPQNGVDGDENGVIKKFNMYAKVDGEWVKVIDEKEIGKDGWQVVEFDTVVKTSELKFEVVDADSANSKVFSSLAEMKLFYAAEADYSKVTAALAEVPADLSGYTVDTVEALNAAIDAVVYGLDYSKQEEVDAYAKAIEDAIDALAVATADYTELNKQIAIAEGLTAELYKDFTAVQEALAAAKGAEADLPASEQATIDALAKALKDAIANLEEKEAAKIEIPTSEMNVSAGSEQQNNATEGLAEYAIDGNANTLWHTDWSGAPRADHWFQVEFDELKEVNSMKIQQRGGDWPNGRILTYNLLGRLSEDDEWFPIIENGRLAENSSWQTVEFDATGVQALRLVSLTSTTDTGIQFSAIAEIRFTETGLPVVAKANYKAVNEAIKAAEALNPDHYTNYDAVQAAIDAVVKGLPQEQQAEVDAMAKAINDAIAALDALPADYSRVEAANASVPTDLSIYTSETKLALISAVTAIRPGLKITQQAEVDAYAKAIEDAIAGLKLKPADYNDVEAAIAQIPTDLTIYTDETVDALNDVLASIDEDLDFTKQETVDAYATAILTAIAELKVKDADYSAVEEAIEFVNALVKENFVDFADVEAAVAAVVEGLDITKQAEVDAMAKAIEDAIAALELKAADYSAVEEALEIVKALVKENYVDFSGVEAAVAAVVDGLNITEQEEVDAMADAILAAVQALQVKPTEPQPPVEPEEPGQPTPDQPEPDQPDQPEPDQPGEDDEEVVLPEQPETPSEDENVNTSDTTSLFAVVSMMVSSVFAFFASRKRKED